MDKRELERVLWSSLGLEPTAAPALADLMEEDGRPRLAAALRLVDWAAARTHLPGWGDMGTVLLRRAGRDKAVPAALAAYHAEREWHHAKNHLCGVDWAGVCRLARNRQAAAALVVGGSEAWTARRAAATKGHEARVAERHMEDGVRVVIVSDRAPTYMGFGFVAGGPVLFYRRCGGSRKYPRPTSVRPVEVVPERADHHEVREAAAILLGR